jgi:hypothetical protein
MTEPAPKTSILTRIEAIVDQWHFESFQGSIVARETQVWNVVHDAKEDLKRRVATLLAELHL